MKDDFKDWLIKYADNKLPMTRNELNDYIKARNY